MNPKCIMLIDDNIHDIFFAKRVIKEKNPDTVIIAMESAVSALDYIRSMQQPKPDLIFLDIYMPVMTGWEFIDEYCQLENAMRGKVMIVMLATSGDPEYIRRAHETDCISDYIIKPLTAESLTEISDKYLKVQRTS